MKILFFPLTSRTNKKGLAPLKIRITMSPTDKTEINTGKFVDPKLWDVDKKRVSGKSSLADIINKYIVSAENKLNKIEADLDRDEVSYNTEIIRNIFFDNHIQRFTLLQMFELNSALSKDKIANGAYKQSALNKYNVIEDKVKAYLKTLNRTDIFISELQQDFIENFHHWLMTKGKNGKEGVVGSTARGMIVKFKKIARMGFKKQNIQYNPFDDFKASHVIKDREPLTLEEVTAIQNKKFNIKRLEKVRDRFIVGCFTGMANADIQTATEDMLRNDLQTGEKWLDRGRTKTGELCLIPLWQPVLDIIEKYKDDLEVGSAGRLFPQISLDKMNVYLQEIGDFCGIEKPLTTHIARHTFGDLYLNSGGTLENLARILGHSSTKSTRGYAKRNRTTITTEANTVRDNLMGYIVKMDLEDKERRIS